MGMRQEEGGRGRMEDQVRGGRRRWKVCVSGKPLSLFCLWVRAEAFGSIKVARDCNSS